MISLISPYDPNITEGGDFTLEFGLFILWVGRNKSKKFIPMSAWKQLDYALRRHVGLDRSGNGSGPMGP